MQGLTPVDTCSIDQDIMETISTRSRESELLCFICAKTYVKNKLIYIFGKEGQNDNLAHKICNYTPFKVAQNEHSAALICEVCRLNINNWDTYLQSCIEAQKILIQELNKFNVPNKTTHESTSFESNEPTSVLTTCQQEYKIVSNTSGLKHTQKLRTTYCIARWCSNNTGNPHHVSFFRIPKDKKRAEQWLSNAGRNDLLNHDIKLLHTKYICERHFTDNMFMNKTHKRLVWNAVPNIFPKPKTFSNIQAETKDPLQNTALLQDYSEAFKNCEDMSLSSTNDSQDENLKEIIDYSLLSKSFDKSENEECISNSPDVHTTSQLIQCDVLSEENNMQTQVVKNFISESESLMREASESFIKNEGYSECLQSSEIMYPCVYCGEVFLVESSLILHQTTYHPGYSVGCGVCGQVEYRSKGEFLEHACKAH